jgi:hypothetical protein
MKRSITVIFIFISCCALYSQAANTKWDIVNTTDQFGDATERKRVVYQTTGIFSNSATTDSKLDVLILSDDPNSVFVTCYEYGKYRVDLTKALFSYKIGSSVIEGVPINGNYDLKYLSNPSYDEKTSLLYLLKQGGEIKVRVYQDGSSYLFTINANGFLEALEKAFTGQEARIKYYYEISDVKGKTIKVSFEIMYNWDSRKEAIFRDNEEIKKIATEYFSEKNRNYAYDRSGKYYDKDKVMQNWGIPFFELIRGNFPNENLEFVRFSAM